ncbi:LPS assembly protein LptD [Lysobacter sp. H21R4]|uniref:LPS assembly protein LptD n=1 Tax=Lysobacter sp. H21R4 TaxID=2781021 RepID=UPI0031F31909
MRNRLHLLPLSMCIALALPAFSARASEDWSLCPLEDAVPAFDDAPAPGGLDGARIDQPTDISGDALNASETDNTVFQGNVALRRGDQFLGTDRLSYRSDDGTYVADGSVRYQDSGMRIVAERAHGDQDADTHTIEDLRYQLIEQRGNGGAERIDIQGDSGSLVGSTYSTCPPSQRSWELQAKRIDFDTEKGTGVARNAVVRVGRVPILYVPWLMFPIDDQRRTGLLYPAVKLSGRNGFDWRQPIYLNLAPNYDATLTPRWMSKRGVQLGGEFRWLYAGGSGELSGDWMPKDRLAENEPYRYLEDPFGNPIPGATLPVDNRGQFQFHGQHSLGGGWRAQANLGWVSDTHYLEDFSNTLYGLSTWQIVSTAGIYGIGQRWDAGLMADHAQLADYTLSEANLTYDRLPRAFLNWSQPIGTWFEAGINAEAVRFRHKVQNEGSRIDLKPYVSMPLEGSSWYVTPKLAWRYTAYDLDDTLAAANGGDATPSRSLPIASLDAGMFFDRKVSFGKDTYTQTLEPRLYYLNVPYRDQNGLPRFDTNPMTFSWGQLFRDNRYTGPDRQIDANQLTTALTTRFINDANGRERLSASLGQIQYFDDSRVVVPGETAVEQGKSAWVADVGISPTKRWSINMAYQWDPKYRRQDLASIRTRYLIGDKGVVNLGYRYRRDLTEQADFSFLYPINQTWSVVGRYYYAIDDRKLLESIAGVQWESCCMAVRLIARRYVRERNGDLDDSLRVEFELKGLGSAGQKTETILSRAILGYDRDDLYLVPPSSVEDDDFDNSLDQIP